MQIKPMKNRVMGRKAKVIFKIVVKVDKTGKAVWVSNPKKMGQLSI